MTARCICDPWAPYEDCPIHGEPGEYATADDGWPLRDCRHDGGECHDIEHQR